MAATAMSPPGCWPRRAGRSTSEHWCRASGSPATRRSPPHGGVARPPPRHRARPSGRGSSTGCSGPACRGRLEGPALSVVEAIAKRDLDCLGIDVPSGVAGDTGQVLGAAPPCRLTVTFFRRKPGQWLLPGRSLCGEIVVADIGIPDSVLPRIGPKQRENAPGAWRDQLPRRHGRTPQISPRPCLADRRGDDERRHSPGGASGAARRRRPGHGRSTLRQPGGGDGRLAGHHCPPARRRRGFSAGCSRMNAATCCCSGRVPASAARPAGGRWRCSPPAAAACWTPMPSRPSPAPRPSRGARHGPCVMTPHEGEFARLFAPQGRQASRRGGPRRPAPRSCSRAATR